MTDAEKKQSDSEKKAAEDSSTSQNTPHMVKRLVGQRDNERQKNGELNLENNDLATEIVRLSQENRLLKEQRTPAPAAPVTEPDPEDFDTDTEYKAAARKFYQSEAGSVVDEKLREFQNNQSEVAQRQSADDATNSHYQRADKIGSEDYEKAESAALNILGEPIFNGIIQNTSNSEQIFLMLGNDPEEAARLRNLAKSNPTAATVEIGRLSAKAVNFKIESRPDPEDELEGGSQLPDIEKGNLRKEYEKILKRASETGDNKGLREIRKRMRDAGLTL